jgi:threonine dehydrogenase-like Zn-dependent dehydrogenase
MSKMIAAKFEGEGIMNFREVEVPRALVGNQVVIKVLAAAICGTDLHIMAVPQSHPCDVGTIFGHECIAEVYEIGPDVTGFKPGDRVAVDPIIPCGTCPSCKSGHYNMCVSLKALGVQVDGVFAPFCLTTADKLYPVSKELPLEKAVFIEMLACIMNGVKRIKMLPGLSVAIFGAGPIGLAFAAVMKSFGAGRVILVEMMPRRIDFARQHAEADEVIDSSKENLVERVRQTTGSGADIVIDTVGILFKEAIDIVRHEGQILLFGINDHVKREILQFDLIRKEVTVVASYATHHSFPMAINMLTTGVVNLDSLLTHKFALKDLAQGIETASKGDGIKVAITMDDQDWRD